MRLPAASAARSNGAARGSTRSASTRRPATTWSRSTRVTSAPPRCPNLLGNPAKALDKLGWRHSTGFEDLVAEMVAADLEAIDLENRTYGNET